MYHHRYIEYVVVAVLLAAFSYFRRTRSKSEHQTCPVNEKQTTVPSGKKSPGSIYSSPKPSKPTQWYKNMFFKLQNMEDYIDELSSARDELLAMFSRSISLTLQKPRESIFRIENYNAENVEKFMEEEHQVCLEKWSHYLKCREQGSGPELFGSLGAAKNWLVQQAPVKFVDGAWLAHLHKVTTPFALRSVTKNAWQVLSEELGDGDLSKHHVQLYKQMLEDVGYPLPEGHSSNFINSPHWNEMDNHGEWVAAVGQLLISLFPDEFLPEILGFNMHYELITMNTLQANHELKELGIDPYYFLIHIVIDNADSGHTAMAVHTVIRYLEMIREKEGDAAAEHAWRRVQVGYATSKNLGASHSPTEESDLNSQAKSDTNLAHSDLLDPLSTRIVNIFKAKSAVSHGFHCQSRVRIGGKPLAKWMAPSTWTSSDPEQGLQLLTALSQAKPWIIPGDSHKSLLMRELAWEGRMFGAFTHDETLALGAWIDALGKGNALLYWNFTRRDPMASEDVVGKLQDPIRHHPVVMPRPNLKRSDTDIGKPSEFRISRQPLAAPSPSRLPDLIPLWFAHIALLENTINTPARTANPIYAHIICLLRAQAGFAAELPIVAGMDELRRDTCPSLVDLGRELVSRAGWSVDNAAAAAGGVDATGVGSLKDVLSLAAHHGQGAASRRLAGEMLDWATRPGANIGLLVGLALAFLDLKEAVARSEELLTEESRCVLTAIVARERQSLEGCAKELWAREEPQYRNLIRGYRLGRTALVELTLEN